MNDVCDRISGQVTYIATPRGHRRIYLGTRLSGRTQRTARSGRERGARARSPAAGGVETPRSHARLCHRCRVGSYALTSLRIIASSLFGVFNE